MNKIFYSSLTSIIIVFLLSSNCLAGSNFNTVSILMNYSVIDSSELEFKCFKRAKSLMSKKDYLGAIKELESIKTSGNAFLKQMLISCYIEIKNFPKAEIVLKEYYKTDGQSPSLVSAMKSLEKKIAAAYSEDSTSYHNFKDSSPALKGYLKRCPYSFYAKEVLDRIDELDYKQAKSFGTEDAYMIYLSEHPNGNFVKEARDNIAILISIENDKILAEARKYDKLAKKSTRNAILLAPLIPIGAVGTYYGLKMTLNDKNSIAGPIILGVSGAGMVMSGLFMAFNIGDIKYNKNWAKIYRSKVRQIPTYSQIRLSPFTDFSTTGGISLNIKF